MSRSDRQPAEALSDELLVSVVAPVRDMPDDARALLAALDRQTLPRGRFEVILSDDGSRSKEIEGLATSDKHVRVLSGPPANSYAARNTGVRAARATVIALCDADCRPEPAWLERGLEALERSDVVAGLIRFIVPDRLSIWGMLDMDTFLDQERSVQSGYGVTANLLFRRELFDRVDGFDDSQPNQGDYDFVTRCVATGATLHFEPNAVVWHPIRQIRSQYLRKVWVVNRHYAERAARSGRKPEGLKLRDWVPVVQTLRGRRRVGRSLLLDRRRLGENGVHPRMRDDLRALPIIYFLVPYLGGIAQLRGGIAGWKNRGKAPGQSPKTPHNETRA